MNQPLTNKAPAADQRTGVRLEKRLLNQVARASERYGMLEEGDRVLVGLSGGKDSYAMMVLLDKIRRKVPFSFELIGVNLDQGHPGFEQQVITDWCDSLGFQHHMIHQDTLSVVKSKIEEGKTYCSLCSRLRRGILYSTANQIGCNKIALGHHKDDVIETLMLNLMFSGQLKGMSPKLTSDDGKNIVIRPLLLCDEHDIQQYSDESKFPILPCNLCGSQDNLQRQNVKAMLRRWNQSNDKVRGNIFAAMSNIRTSHLLDLDLRKAVDADSVQEDDDSVL